MIGFSTITADTDGCVIIDGTYDFRDNTARVVRTATLDGGVYINHSGTTDGDRTVTLTDRVTEAQAAALWYIFNNYTSVHISLPDGFFKATISSVKIDNGALNMAIYLETKESE